MQEQRKEARQVRGNGAEPLSGGTAIRAPKLGPGAIGGDDSRAPGAFPAITTEKAVGFPVDQLDEVTLQRFEIAASEPPGILGGIFSGVVSLESRHLDGSPLTIMAVPGALNADLDGHDANRLKPLNKPAKFAKPEKKVQGSCFGGAIIPPGVGVTQAAPR